MTGPRKRKRLDQVFNDQLEPNQFIVEGFTFYHKGSIYRVIKGDSYNDLLLENVITGKNKYFDIDFIYENCYQLTEMEHALYG